MKVTIIDMNNIEVFVSLEDGRILSFPANTIENPQIGDTLDFPKSDLSCSSNKHHYPNILVNNLIDFF